MINFQLAIVVYYCDCRDVWGMR